MVEEELSINITPEDLNCFPDPYLHSLPFILKSQGTLNFMAYNVIIAAHGKL